MCTPVDLVKCRLQVQKESKANAYYKGPVDVIKKVIRDEGLKGLYRGQTCMIIREIPLFATQFGTFFLFRREFAQKYYNCKIDDLPTLPILVAGGLSGLCCWTVAFPLVTPSNPKTNIGLNKNAFASGKKCQICQLQPLNPRWRDDQRRKTDVLE